MMSLRQAILVPMILLAACETGGEPTPERMEFLETATREYKGCIRAAISALGPRTRAYHAAARAAESLCAARRDDVESAALAAYSESNAEDFLDTLDAWSVVEARRILSRG